MQKYQPKDLLKVYLLFVFGILWVAVLIFLMVEQNESPTFMRDPTITTFESIHGASTTHNMAHSNEPITPLPDFVNVDSGKVALGFKLFIDTKLSHDNTISCESCHHVNQGGSDKRPLSLGINTTIGERNSPTVFNSTFNFYQFWDAHATTLEEQIDGPTHNPKEMASSWAEILQKLSATPEYQMLFNEIYGTKKITANAVRDAIATFERALTTPNSSFDRWLKGDENAMSDRQKEGYKIFKMYGCISCHHGINIGGSMIERLGVFKEYYDTHPASGVDVGRFGVTGNEAHRHEFKVPSLRNIKLTAPYLHDGSIETLREIIDVMAIYQLGEKLTESEKDAIEDFLGTLTGDKPAILK